MNSFDFVSLKNIFSNISTENLPGWNAHQKMAPPHKELPSAYYQRQPEKFQHSAVLICICPSLNSQSWGILMMKRTSSPFDIHSGQMSFPGGRSDPSDISLEMTALREFKEETGCTLSFKIDGVLSHVIIPVSHYIVQPFVSVFSEFPELKPDSREVQKIIHIPFEFLLNKKNITYHRVRNLFNVPAWYYQHEIIWGASAMMIAELCHIIQKGYSSK